MMWDRTKVNLLKSRRRFQLSHWQIYSNSEWTNKFGGFISFIKFSIWISKFSFTVPNLFIILGCPFYIFLELSQICHNKITKPRYHWATEDIVEEIIDIKSALMFELFRSASLAGRWLGSQLFATFDCLWVSFLVLHFQLLYVLHYHAGPACLGSSLSLLSYYCTRLYYFWYSWLGHSAYVNRCVSTYATISNSPSIFSSFCWFFLLTNYLQFLHRISFAVLLFPTLVTLPPPFPLLLRCQMHM